MNILAQLRREEGCIPHAYLCGVATDPRSLRQRSGEINRPSFVNPAVHQRYGDAVLFSDLAPRFATGIAEDEATVNALLKSGSPAAVCSGVSGGIVAALKTEPVRVTILHRPRSEHGEVGPFIAHADAASTIAGESSCVLVRTSVDHPLPDSVKARPAAAVRSQVCAATAAVAAARQTLPAAKVGAGDDAEGATRAFAAPQGRAAICVPGFISHQPTTESEPGHFDQSWVRAHGAFYRDDLGFRNECH